MLEEYARACLAQRRSRKPKWKTMRYVSLTILYLFVLFCLGTYVIY